MTPPPSRSPLPQQPTDPQTRAADALEDIRRRLNVVIVLLVILLAVVLIALARAAAVTNQFQ
jgi:hypothetical protein